MWKMCWNHEVMSLFQMEKQSGIGGIAAMHPHSVDDLAVLNSAIRLMAQEKGGEIPVQKLARFKADSRCWDAELSNYGLGQKEKEVLMPALDISYGLCIAQEQFMQLVQIPELGGFDLTWADKLRKSIAKKNPAAYDALTKEYFETVEEKKLNYGLCKYVWNVLIAMSRGYGFNQSHTLAYSLIALQELNLAYKFPILYWNCACLIADSGGNEQEENEEENVYDVPVETYSNEIEEFGVDDNEDDIEDSYNEEDCDGYPSEVVVLKDGKKKKKVKSTNYGKIATAIGKIRAEGIEVSPPDINYSSYTFTPDLEHNTIRYGLSGISKVGDDIVKMIMENRPYDSLKDFISKNKINKPQMVNLIKSGAFDLFDDRYKIMKKYIEYVSDSKQRITLQNMKMLIDFGLLPQELDFECKVFNFNKYLKKFKDGDYYSLDENSMRFYENNFDMDNLYFDGGRPQILQSIWDKKYKTLMNPVRDYIKKHQEELLNNVNDRLTSEMWNKYCLGTISKWEMDSISYYYHEHELANIDLSIYGCVNYEDLPDKPVIDRQWFKDGKRIQMFKIYRIAGVVLDKDKNKGMITLLTTDGVVNVKIFGPVFTNYDKQISERGIDGKKHVMEKSWLSRGNKIIITGIKQNDGFLAKKYKNTPYHLVELIESIEGSYVVTKTHRYGEDGDDN